MNGKALGIIGVIRFVGWTRLQLYETLYFSSDKLIVSRTATGSRADYGAINAVTGYYTAKAQEETMENLSPEEILSSDENNFALPYNQIDAVILKKFLGAVQVTIRSNGEKYKWSVRGLPHSDRFTLENVVENFASDISGETRSSGR